MGLDHARVTPRPFAYIGAAHAEHSRIRDHIGRSSFDALALASAEASRALYADDLGLRRLVLVEDGASADDRVPSFSSVSLVAGLSLLGVMTIERRDRALLELLRRRYVHCLVTPGVLLAALKSMHSLAASELERVFASLGSPLVTPVEAARIAAIVLRTVATQGVRRVAIGRVAELAILGMARATGQRVAASLVVTAASASLLLLPLDLEEVQRVCRRFGAS